MKIFNKIFNIIKKREIMIDIKEIKYKKCNQYRGNLIADNVSKNIAFRVQLRRADQPDTRIG